MNYCRTYACYQQLQLWIFVCDYRTLWWSWTNWIESEVSKLMKQRFWVLVVSVTLCLLVEWKIEKIEWKIESNLQKIANIFSC